MPLMNTSYMQTTSNMPIRIDRNNCKKSEIRQLRNKGIKYTFRPRVKNIKAIPFNITKIRKYPTSFDDFHCNKCESPLSILFHSNGLFFQCKECKLIDDIEIYERAKDVYVTPDIYNEVKKQVEFEFHDCYYNDHFGFFCGSCGNNYDTDSYYECQRGNRWTEYEYEYCNYCNDINPKRVKDFDKADKILQENINAEIDKRIEEYVIEKLEPILSNI